MATAASSILHTAEVHRNDIVLKADPVAHRYSVEEDGKERRVFSVSDILVGTGMVNTEWMTEQGKWRGSAVHQATWFDDEGDLDEAQRIIDIEGTDITDTVLGHCNGWRKFRRETGFKPHTIEQPIFHPIYDYAGTPDRVGTLGNGMPCIPDLKTGAHINATRYQLVGYAACYQKPRLFTRMEVRTKANGTYTLKIYPPSDYQRDFDRWLHLVATFHIKREEGLL